MNVHEKRDELMAEARALYANENKSRPLDHWLERLADFAAERERKLELTVAALRKGSRVAAAEPKVLTFYAGNVMTKLEAIHARKVRREEVASSLRRRGLTFREVGEALGVSASRAQAMVAAGEREKQRAARRREHIERNTEEREAAMSLRRYRSARAVLSLMETRSTEPVLERRVVL